LFLRLIKKSRFLSHRIRWGELLVSRPGRCKPPPPKYRGESCRKQNPNSSVSHLVT